MSFFHSFRPKEGAVLDQDSLQARHPHRPTKHDAKKHSTHPRTSQQVLCGEHQHDPHQDRTDPD